MKEPHCQGGGEHWTSGLLHLLASLLGNSWLRVADLGQGGWCLCPIVEEVRYQRHECLENVDRPGAGATVLPWWDGLCVHIAVTGVLQPKCKRPLFREG